MGGDDAAADDADNNGVKRRMQLSVYRLHNNRVACSLSIIFSPPTPSPTPTTAIMALPSSNHITRPGCSL